MAETDEEIVEGAGGFGEDVAPLETDGHVVEDETAEEAVFGIGDERENLARSAGKQSREARLVELNKFTIFTSGVRNHFMMESFAKSVRKISII